MLKNKTMRYILYFLFVWISVSAQPFAIGSTAITFTDVTRNNRSVGTQIYYPAVSAGTDTPVASGSFPVIAFGHGFVMNVGAYQNIWELLVPQGYIVALPTTEGGFSPSHLNFAQDLAFVITQIKAQNTQNGAFFFQRIHPKAGVMGHSMGGGSAHLAAALGAPIDALCTLAPAETNPSAISASQNITLPSLVIAGSNDCITPPNTNQLPMYNALPSGTCKAYLSITGGSHCQMANSNFNCSFGEATCAPGPTITRSQQQAILHSYLLLWMNAQLKDSCSDRDQLLQLLNAANGVTAQWQCTSCALDLANLPQEKGLRLANPMLSTLSIPLPATAIQSLILRDIQGKIVLEKNNSATIAVDFLAAGTYILELTTKSGERYQQKLMKQ